MGHFDLSLLLHGDYLDWLLAGFGLSLKLTAITLVFALPLGASVALLRLAPSRLANAVGATYVEAIRNVPLLAHMLFWYFGAPELLPDAWKERLYAGNVEVIAAVVALTLYTGAYMAEDIRSGINAIARGQIEAGRSLGFGYLATMRLIILPQALRITLPPLVSQTLNLWKDSSIATVIGVAELMYEAQRVETTSFRSVEAFVFASICYLGVSLLIGALAVQLQRRYPVRGGA